MSEVYSMTHTFSLFESRLTSPTPCACDPGPKRCSTALVRRAL